MAFRCRNTLYCQNADVFDSVADFLGMCSAVFGARPDLTERGGFWYDDGDELVLEPVRFEGPDLAAIMAAVSQHEDEHRGQPSPFAFRGPKLSEFPELEAVLTERGGRLVRQMMESDGVTAEDAARALGFELEARGHILGYVAFLAFVSGANGEGY